MGGQSSEREISLRTGRAVHRALQARGYDAVPIDVSAAIIRQLQANHVKMAFLALHGPGGEDGTMQGLLEVMGIPYTGSGVRASAIAMHKVTTKTVLDSYGISVPPGVVLRTERKGDLPKSLPAALRLPVVVKPAAEGSTIGVSIVRRAADWLPALTHAARYDREIIVESYIAGHEIAVSVLACPEHRRRTRPVALPAVEIVAPGGFYDYAAKYTKGRTRYLCPAPLPNAVNRRVAELAVRTYEVIGCDGAARVDFRVTPQGKPYVLEVNTIPGMTETSLLPMAAARVGMDYEALTERILESALRRAHASA
jgi:D-alanine-D-alanine ligase